MRLAKTLSLTKVIKGGISVKDDTLPLEFKAFYYMDLVIIGCLCLLYWVAATANLDIILGRYR